MSLCVVREHAQMLFAYSLHTHRFFPRILRLRVDTIGAYGEVFRADGELQGFSPRFLDLRRDGTVTIDTVYLRRWGT